MVSCERAQVGIDLHVSVEQCMDDLTAYLHCLLQFWRSAERRLGSTMDWIGVCSYKKVNELVAGAVAG